MTLPPDVEREMRSMFSFGAIVRVVTLERTEHWYSNAFGRFEARLKYVRLGRVHWAYHWVIKDGMGHLWHGISSKDNGNLAIRLYRAQRRAKKVWEAAE